MTSSLSGVWEELVGQAQAVEVLQQAVRAARQTDGVTSHAMTHAWLIAGPPGSGRSNAARAFAAALLCPDQGCGGCQVCRTVRSGAHPDVTVVRTEKLSIGVAEARELATRAAMSPTVGAYQIIIVEDADRITVAGADALLKSLEEPPARTVWLLCAPTADDLIVTIRSRTRQVRLHTPTDEDVARLLNQRDGIEMGMALQAARAARGHVGRARALARDETVRHERDQMCALPGRLTSLRNCLDAASWLVKQATERAQRITADMDAAELAELKAALGMNSPAARPRHAQAAIRELEDEQKMRAKRLQRDALDAALTELTTWYRDVLVVQLGSGEIINTDHADQIAAQAASCSPEETLRRADAIVRTRQALEASVAPLLAMEALMCELMGVSPA